MNTTSTGGIYVATIRRTKRRVIVRATTTAQGSTIFQGFGEATYSEGDLEDIEPIR